MRRKRRDPQEGDFEDPLKDYRPPEHEDELEQSLIEGNVGQMKIVPFTAVSPDTTIEQVIRRMAELNVACVLIVEDERLRGIFSERDVLNKVVDEYEQVKDKPVAELMTPDPAAVRRTDSPAKALNLMAVNGFRHLPILDVDDNVVGILGPRRVTEHLKTHFA